MGGPTRAWKQQSGRREQRCRDSPPTRLAALRSLVIIACWKDVERRLRRGRGNLGYEHTSDK